MAAFKIGDDEFPIPASFTLADGPLVYEASGLEFDEFAERMDGMEGNADIRALTALVAVAVSRARPHWPRRRVVQFLASVDLEDFKIEGDDDGPPAVPPETADTKLSDGSSTASTTSPEATSGAPV